MTVRRIWLCTEHPTRVAAPCNQHGMEHARQAYMPLIVQPDKDSRPTYHNCGIAPDFVTFKTYSSAKAYLDSCGAILSKD